MISFGLAVFGWSLFFVSLIYFSSRSMHAHEQCIDFMRDTAWSCCKKTEKIDRQINDILSKMDAILKQ